MKASTLIDRSVGRISGALRVGVLALAISVAGIVRADKPMIPTEVVDAFHSALARGDAAAALSLMHRDLVVYEFGVVDATMQAYAFTHLPVDMTLAAQTRWDVQTRRMGGSGDQRWVLSSYRVVGKDASGAPIDQVMLETVILQRLSEAYRIVHIHWSSISADQKNRLTAPKPR